MRATLSTASGTMSPVSPAIPVPQHCPSPRELDDLELLTHGVLGLAGFEGAGGLVTLHVPHEVAAAATDAGALELVDPEGLPLARVEVASTYDAGDATGVTGPVTALSHHEFGAFRRLYLSPAEVAERHDDRTLTVPVAGPLTEPDLRRITEHAAGRPRPAAGARRHRHPRGPVRTGTAARHPHGRGERCRTPPWWRSRWRRAATRPRTTTWGSGWSRRTHRARSSASPARASCPRRSPRSSTATAPGPASRASCCSSPGCPAAASPRSPARCTTWCSSRASAPSPASTATSSGGTCPPGLTFSKQDRETNIRRIGWVAAEISRHGGVAICSPIAPFDETRRQVRAMTEEAGGAFVLVHVATPLEECERRDRKGLYAKARRGEIPEFTGISSPYEEPEDAAVRVDTTGRTIEDALSDVLDTLYDAGHLTPPD